ncbi:GlxA family transcriptional regulator [Kiloniella sp. b19]|uniref:GlxA family transcriptional regulator n=1 Tax=Kiloniella sp. GXU_MW_B19 TaxID=3141326 RepID=UPI0031DADD92
MQEKETENAPGLHVAFLLLPQFTLTPFSSMIDILRLTADEGDQSRPIRCRWTLIGLTDDPVTSSCGVEIKPWADCDDLGQYDYLVVVGGLLKGQQAPGPVLDVIRRAAQQKVRLVGLCTGSFALVRAGIMKGRRCCVSWYHHNDLLALSDEVTPVSSQMFVVDGHRITCAGGTGAIDLAVWMVEQHLGRGVAQKAMRIMQVDRVRGGTAAQPQPSTYLNASNDRVRKALIIIEQNLSTPLKVQEIAEQINVSKRHLERLFLTELGHSPQTISREIRLHHGLWQLMHTNRSISDIAADCGFSDAAHFSRLFSKSFGEPPSTLRAAPERANDLLAQRPLLQL